MHKPSDYLKKDGEPDTSLDEFFNREAKGLTDDELGQVVARNREAYAQWQREDAEKADKKRVPKKKKGVAK